MKLDDIESCRVDLFFFSPSKLISIIIIIPMITKRIKKKIGKKKLQKLRNVIYMKLDSIERVNLFFFLPLLKTNF